MSGQTLVYDRHEEHGPLFLGFQPRECGEHRTVGSHRAWCFDCGEWCYPKAPCVRCEIVGLRPSDDTHPAAPAPATDDASRRTPDTPTSTSS